MYFQNQHIYTSDDIEHYLNDVKNAIKKISFLFKGINSNLVVLQSSVAKLDQLYQAFGEVRRLEEPALFSIYTNLPLEDAATNGSIINGTLYPMESIDVERNIGISYKVISNLVIDGSEKHIDGELKKFVTTGPLIFNGSIATPEYETSKSALFDNNSGTTYEVWLSLPSEYDGMNIQVKKPVIFELSFSFPNDIYIGSIDMYMDKGVPASASYKNSDGKEGSLPIIYNSYFSIKVNKRINFLSFNINGV